MHSRFGMIKFVSRWIHSIRDTQQTHNVCAAALRRRNGFLGQLYGNSGVQRRYFDDRYDWSERMEGRTRRDAQKESQPQRAAGSNDDDGLEQQNFSPQHNNSQSDLLNNASDYNQERDKRRLLHLNTLEHQRMQERIIEENLRKYSSASSGYNKDENSRSQCAAQRYSRRRRAARQKALKLQQRDSHQDLKLHTTGASRPKPSKAWLDKQKRELESQFWHSWESCPSERKMYKSAKESTQPLANYESRGEASNELTRPLPPYDSSRRRYQTVSKKLQEQSSCIEPTAQSPFSGMYEQTPLWEPEEPLEQTKPTQFNYDGKNEK